MDSVEDQAFGPEESPHNATSEDVATPQTVVTWCWTQRVSDYMVVIVTIPLLILLLAYTTLKSIEYHELVQRNVRYRNARIRINTTAVVLAMGAVIYTVHGEAVSVARFQEK